MRPQGRNRNFSRALAQHGVVGGRDICRHGGGFLFSEWGYAGKGVKVFVANRADAS